MARVQPEWPLGPQWPHWELPAFNTSATEPASALARRSQRNASRQGLPELARKRPILKAPSPGLSTWPGFDVSKVRRFSRHAKHDTLLKYNDNRRDEAGVLAKMLGEDSE
jgi:hypothetical protein